MATGALRTHHPVSAIDSDDAVRSAERASANAQISAGVAARCVGRSLAIKLAGIDLNALAKFDVSGAVGKVV